MTLTIDIPEELVNKAADLGIPVETLVKTTLEEASRNEPIETEKSAAEAQLRRDEAGRRIKEIARTHTLGGLKIRDLIEEGRRY